MFIMLGGIDGCGKGFIAKIIAEEFIKRGMKIFDLREFEKKEKKIPEFKEVKNADVYLSAEMTYAWIGAALREEITRKSNRTYSAESAAHAFALDREILYKRFIIPARNAGKIIIQERGVESSIAYQPIQDDSIALDDILALPGNQLALQNAPDILIIPKLSAETAIKRLAARSEKQDGSIFERLDFLQQLAKRYYSADFKKIFEDRGTKVVYINTEGTLEETRESAKKLFEKIA